MLPISNVAPLYQEGLEIPPQPAQSGNEIVTAMVSGDLQYASQNPEAARATNPTFTQIPPTSRTGSASRCR